MNRKVSAQSTASRQAIPLTWPQRYDLLALREQYRRARDFFSAREYAHLRFIRWLYQTGRLEP